MKTKDITPLEYAKYRGQCVANISKHIRKGNLAGLPHVITIKSWSRFYTLEVPVELNAGSFKTEGMGRLLKSVGYFFLTNK